MENSHKKDEICKTLATIAGADITGQFGEPFLTAYKRVFKCDNEEITAAAYSCSLFLSAILEGFPTAKLHTFIRYTRENCRTIAFNCKMYENIYSHMGGPETADTVLLDRNGKYKERQCSKNEIFEAFDFYTNQ